MHSLALFGGAFDPIHKGHLQTSLAVQDEFQFDDYYFVPCKLPAIKSPSIASCEQRVKMLQLAIKINPQFKIDTREIERSSPSYMVDTLMSFRKEYPNASITLIIGYDAFLGLPKWHQWKKLTTLANILVINRNYYANETLATELMELLQKHTREDSVKITEEKNGIIQFYDAGHFEISSSAIRKKLKSKDTSVVMDLPSEIYNYIKSQQLYQ